jgi:hypothetical protein
MALDEVTCESGPIQPSATHALIWRNEWEERMLYLRWRHEGTDHYVTIHRGFWGVNYHETIDSVVMHVDPDEPRLAFEIRRTATDSACTEPLGWDIERTDQVFCEIAAGVPSCTEPIPTRVRVVEIRSFGDDELLEDLRVVEDFTLRVERRGARLVIRRASGRVPPGERRLLGRHTIASLQARSRW